MGWYPDTVERFTVPDPPLQLIAVLLMRIPPLSPAEECLVIIPDHFSIPAHFPVIRLGMKVVACTATPRLQLSIPAPFPVIRRKMEAACTATPRPRL